MVFLGKILMWGTLPWCAFLFYGALGVSPGNFASMLGGAVTLMLMFGWIPWVAGRILVMIAQRMGGAKARGAKGS